MNIDFQTRLNTSSELTPVGVEALEENDSGLFRLAVAQYAVRLDRESGDGFPQRLALVVFRAPDGTVSVRFERGATLFEQLATSRPLILNDAGEATRVLRWSEGTTQHEERLAVAVWASHGRLSASAQLDSKALQPRAGRPQPSIFVGQIKTTHGLYVGSAPLR